jgi:hypothetical protein
MTLCTIQRYLVSSSLLFGTLGFTHGLMLYKVHDMAYSITQESTRKIREQQMIQYVAGGVLYGLLLGPWVPVIGPIWLAKAWPHTKCKYLIR